MSSSASSSSAHAAFRPSPTEAAQDPTPKGSRQVTQQDDADNEEEDPYDARIRRSGCAKEHEALQDCHFETRDYRQCQQQLLAFKDCWKRTHPEASYTSSSS